MKKSKIITSIGNHLARRRTNHIKHILFKKKPDYLGMIYMKIAEPLVCVVGKIRRSWMIKDFIIKYMKEFVDKIIFIRDYIKSKFKGDKRWQK